MVYAGKDRVALLYVAQMMTLCADLVAKVKKALKQDIPPKELTTHEFQRSFRLAVWSAYTIQT